MEIPERSVEDDQGQRRKRMMRQIEDVIATHDARHALVLCTDGGVLYFRNSDEETAQVRDTFVTRLMSFEDAALTPPSCPLPPPTEFDGIFVPHA